MFGDILQMVGVASAGERKIGHAYRADIDGLRALAVALVVVFHAMPLAIPGGFVGVDVFFVISGYLITELILEAQASRHFSVRGFYARRARRILPALGIVIGASLIIGWFALFPGAYERLGWEAICSALFFPNLLYWSEAGYFDAVAQSKPLLHLWSLGVEEQFYLVWPALLIVLHRCKERRTAILGLISAASLIYSGIAAFYDPTAAFYSPLSRLWELGIGSILASHPLKLRAPQLVSLLGLAVIAGSALLLSAGSVFPGALALPPVLGAAMVIVGRSGLLSLPPLVAVGLISYPLYLWHWPLLSFASALDFHTELAKGIVVVVSVILAWLTARYIEYPIRFGRLRRAGVPISAAAMALAVIGALAIVNYGGLPERYAPGIRPALATKEYNYSGPSRVGICMINPGQNFARECGDGDILLWGDSYSGMLSTGFPKPYAQFTQSVCMPLLTGDSDACSRGNVLVLSQIARAKPKRVILFARWLLRVANWQSEPKLKQDLMHTLATLQQSVGDIVVIGPSPIWWPSLPELVYWYWSKHGELPDRLGAAAQNQLETNAVMRSIADAQHVRFISILDLLCNVDGCLTHTPRSRSELLAFDDGHFTVEGARYVVQTLKLDRLTAD